MKIPEINSLSVSHLAIPPDSTTPSQGGPQIAGVLERQIACGKYVPNAAREKQCNCFMLNTCR